MTTLFIADLHLDESRPAMVEAFLGFLARDARRSDALFILGDLFDTWIGDDDDAPLARTVADGLAALSDAGIPISFLHGNRDFLLGEDYARRCGMTLLPEQLVLDIEGCATLIMHGDTLCTEDNAYQQFRSKSREPAWQRTVLSQPLPERRTLALHARIESERHTRSAIPSVMDVAPPAVDAVLERTGVTRMIHGHTHRRAIHGVANGQGAAERIVLGDWYERGSALVVDGPALRFIAV